MIELQPFDPVSVVLIGLLNPVAIAVAVLMGRAADQWQKLVVAAFASACAGSLFVWVLAFVGLLPARGIGGEAGVFVTQFILGLVWAWIGYRWLRKHDNHAT
ncbi:conserved membrane protein of unknown function [Candidatus Filomicrobium marinum]|uniref:Uncharacterized protein n=2 Tax=Filomicrobium TaxID=119044 RepID=A0A0D6JAD0_9HYPH|nr:MULTISPECIES: hypothetical protein [Filomicrobium]MCV0368571.1 hypothetical protein [Filomicrobium sp.]CFX01516.1 conserved membrane protein of unknown function [Candidatus Filomicrobium marinum]CPR15457.1 conserved membrane protein of unknown function [Candidatus Filomicrobium marinum]SDO64748.1 hypothetical protein SAMN04488061_1297 [Filomicrobium insigne]